MRRGRRPAEAEPGPSTDPLGEVEVYVADEQDAIPIDTDQWLRLAAQVLAAENVARSGRDVEMSLLFVDEATITAQNQRFMGASGPTDVLSFPIDDDALDAPVGPFGGSPSLLDDEDQDPDEMPVMLGDVVICPSVAIRNVAERLGVEAPGPEAITHELALLLVHGILHLLGHDHEKDDEAAIMQAREVTLLLEFHAESPTSAEPGAPNAEIADGVVE